MAYRARSPRTKSSSSSGIIPGGCALSGCGCWIAVIILNLTLGAYCFSYSAHEIFGVEVPLILAVIGGLFLGELTIPVAVIVWILVSCGVHTPMVG
jgi:hypothetical protein